MNYTGKMLKDLRNKAGYTQLELSKLLGISRETVINIENENPGSIRTLEIEVLRRWWFICGNKVDDNTKNKFLDMIRSIFSLKL